MKHENIGANRKLNQETEYGPVLIPGSSFYPNPFFVTNTCHLAVEKAHNLRFSFKHILCSNLQSTEQYWAVLSLKCSPTRWTFCCLLFSVGFQYDGDCGFRTGNLFAHKWHSTWENSKPSDLCVHVSIFGRGWITLSYSSHLWDSNESMQIRQTHKAKATKTGNK